MFISWCNSTLRLHLWAYNCHFNWMMLIKQVLFSLFQSWHSPQMTRSPQSMKIVLFADFASSSHGLHQAQYMLKQLCNEGHQITLFGKLNWIKFLIFAFSSTLQRKREKSQQWTIILLNFGFYPALHSKQFSLVINFYFNLVVLLFLRCVSGCSL